MEHILEEFSLHPLVKLQLFGIDLSITKAVIMMWIVSALIFIVLIIAARQSRLVPSGFYNVVESIIEYIRDEFVLGVIGEEGLEWFSLIATLFFFILGANLLGLIPGGFTATSNINVTATLAVIVFFIYHVAGIRKMGVVRYFKSWIPSGIPIPIAIMMIPIEIIGHFARPFSLAVRLFANMFAGHTIILVFLSMIIFFKSYIIAPLPLAAAVLMNLLEILFSIIQAYIFTILAALYISMAIHEAH